MGNFRNKMEQIYEAYKMHIHTHCQYFSIA